MLVSPGTMSEVDNDELLEDPPVLSAVDVLASKVVLESVAATTLVGSESVVVVMLI